MENSQKRWLVKNQDGVIQGPLSTSEVISLMRRGEVSEEDFVALFPGTKWHAISQNPEFFDILLELISGVESDPEIDDASLKELDKKVFSDLPKNKSEIEEPFSETEGPINSEDKDFEFTQTGSSAEEGADVGANENSFGEESPSYQVKTASRKDKRSENSIIELAPMEEAKKRAKVSLSVKPVLFLIVAGILSYVVLMLPESREAKTVRLLAPQQQRKLSQEEIKNKYELGISYFYKDSLEGYLNAQNAFVQIVEAHPKSVNTMALLCLVYHEIWPYTQKDTKDMAVVSKVLQMAKKIDPAGEQGNTCKVAQLLMNAKYEEAETVTEGVLSTLSNDQAPPVAYYYFKALHLYRKNSFQSALSYITSVERLWPNWLRAYMLEAQLREKMGAPDQAAERYRQVLNANPKHKEAFLRLGHLEYKVFLRHEEAEKIFLRAIKIDSFAPAKLQSDAYLNLAEMALKKNKSEEACQFAKKSYEYFSVNQAAKNLVLQSCGKGELKVAKARGDALVEEGRILEREGDCNAAQALYKAAYERNSSNGVAALLAAKCLWKLSFSTEAIDWLNKAIKADPQLIEAYLQLADYFSQRYDFEAAGVILQKASRLAPQNFEVFRGYAVIEMRRRNYKSAIAYALRALKINESDVDTHIVLARAYLEDKNYNEAYTFANRGIELDPNNREAHVVYAETLAGVQGVDSGLDYLGRLIQQYPLVTDYRLALGKMYQKEGRFLQAAEVYQQVIELDSKPKEAMIELGKVLRISNSHKQALEVFFDAAQMDPADPQPLFEAGLLYLGIKKPDLARQQFLRVKKINPLFPLVHYYLGKAALLGGSAEDAIAMAEQERRVNPNLSESYLLAAEAYTRLRRYSLCAKEYQKAIQLVDQSAVVYVKLASCYRKSGNLDIAISMLNQAATKESGLADIYREQGQIFEMKTDYDRAIQSYNQYLVLNPTAPDVAQVRERIRSLELK